MNKIGDDYLILRVLGSGAFAEVYKVKHLEYGYIRALRILRNYIDSEDNKLYRGFLRECKVLLRLGNGCHPNIVHIYQPRLVNGRALVEMDYVDGEDLRHLIDRYDGKVPIEEILRMVREMGSALAYCHHDIYKFCYDKTTDGLEDDPDDGTKALITPEVEQYLIKKYRVIHNDIHIGNIMRRNDGNYIMLDFGLAVDGEKDVVGSSRLDNGAIEYKSPARFDCMEPTPQDDIYSFGCVIYAMLTGNPPFPIQTKGKSFSFGEQTRIYNAHKETPPPPIERDDAPGWLIDLTMRCLSKKPDDRYADGYELYREICLHNESPQTDTQPQADAEVVERLKAEIEFFKSENDSLKEELTQSKKEVFVLKSAKNHVDPQLINQLMADNDMLKKESLRLKEALESVQAENRALKKDNDSLKATIEQSHNEPKRAEQAEAEPQQPEAEPEHKRCPKCGNLLREGVRFCKICGNRL